MCQKRFVVPDLWNGEPGGLFGCFRRDGSVRSIFPVTFSLFFNCIVCCWIGWRD